MDTIKLNVADPCPGCGGSFRKCPQPTPAMRKAAADTRDSERWIPVLPTFDTAPLEDVERLGELWKCTGCGMPHRVKPEDAPAYKAPRPA